MLISSFKILEFVKVVDCYPNVSISYRILLTMINHIDVVRIIRDVTYRNAYRYCFV